MEFLSITTVNNAPNREEYRKSIRHYRRMQRVIIEFLMSKGLSESEAELGFHNLSETKRKLILEKIK